MTDAAEHHLRTLLATGTLASALGVAEQVAHQPAVSATHLLLAAETFARAGRFDQALAAAARATAVAPNDPGPILEQARYLLLTGRLKEALAATSRLTGATLGAAASDLLGTILTRCGEAAAALGWFAQAVRLDPDNQGFRYNLAMAERMMGDLAACEQNLDLVLKRNPTDGEAQLARSGLRQQTHDANHISELREALRRVRNPAAGVAIDYALAKELEDLGRHAESFDHLRAASEAHRRSFRYDVAGDIAVLSSLAPVGVPSPAQDATGMGHDALFILGLPRSGTTLVDRILSAHPEVVSRGETDAFATELVRAVQSLAGSQGIPKESFAAFADRVPLASLGDAYLAAARPAEPRRFFTDKTPINYLYVRYIAQALPGARFIALERHPVDTCFAMYKAFFVGAYPFSYDLLEIGRYYVAWRQLMTQWREWAGGAWLTVRYEDMVRDQEAETRRLLAHCGLPWDDATLRFHAQGGAVATASATQVRRPIYSDSVGRWRAYQTELAPLITYLAEAGVEIE